MMAEAAPVAAQGALDYAGLAALLAVLGSGLWKIWTSWQTRDERRAKMIAAAEAAEESKRDELIKQQAEKLEFLDARLRLVERGYHAFAGVFHILVDDVLRIDPIPPSLELIERHIRMHFPVAGDMPAELASLCNKLDERRAG